MTAEKNRKRLVRERQARTGESSTAALRHLRPNVADPARSGIPVAGRAVREHYRALLNERLPADFP